MTDTSDPDPPLADEDLEAYDEPLETEPPPDEVEASILLSPADSLGDTGVFELQARSPTQSVLVIGPPAAGKTTLLAALYELFGLGHGKRFEFAGSETLLAFERIAHHARAMSRNVQGSTERTRPGSRRFLHLGLRDKERDEFVDLILADLSGENFDELIATDSTTDYDDVRPFAAHVSFVLDGERLVDPSTRHVAVQQIRTGIRAATERGWFQQGDLRELIVSKMDLVHEAEPESRDWAKERIDELAALLDGPALSTSARDWTPAGSSSLEQLISRWCVERPVRVRAESTGATAGRSFDRFVP